MPRCFTFHQCLRGDTALVIGGGRKARVADNVTDGIDVRQRGLIEAIHLQLTTAVGLQANVFQRQRFGVAGTAVGKQQAVGFEFFAGFQVHDDAIVYAFNLLVLFVVANHHAAVPEVIGKRI